MPVVPSHPSHHQLESFSERSPQLPRPLHPQTHWRVFLLSYLVSPPSLFPGLKFQTLLILTCFVVEGRTPESFPGIKTLGFLQVASRWETLGTFPIVSGPGLGHRHRGEGNSTCLVCLLPSSEGEASCRCIFCFIATLVFLCRLREATPSQKGIHTKCPIAYLHCGGLLAPGSSPACQV